MTLPFVFFTGNDRAASPEEMTDARAHGLRVTITGMPVDRTGWKVHECVYFYVRQRPRYFTVGINAVHTPLHRGSYFT